LESQAVPTKTIIGVVGNTGAGKSSVINALVDEQRLLPTSCMRACTAVVTELSYNHEQAPYRAEIEFIAREDWRKELETLLHDLIDPNGAVSRQCTDEDSDAGVAYAKIKAVYPRKTKEEIANTSIDTMLQEVSSLLGSTIPITEYDPARFYSRLQHYVDSKEKATGDKKDKKKDRQESDREVWPLIRVVRYVIRCLGTLDPN
jgi:ABC-type dipeptide/oligopeptide/nickel transport system ATPase component